MIYYVVYCRRTLATAEAVQLLCPAKERIKSSCGTSATPRGPATFKLGPKVTRRHNARITILKASRSVCPKAPQKQRTIYNACMYWGEGAMRTTPFDVADRLLRTQKFSKCGIAFSLHRKL